jgi:TolB protein
MRVADWGSPLSGRLLLAAMAVAISLTAAAVASTSEASGTIASISFTRGASIFLVSRDGTHVSRVLRGTGTDDFLPGAVYYSESAWSPDGRLLAVREEEATESHGYDTVVVRKGKREVARLEGESSIAGNPSWAPDGKRLVYVGYQSDAGGGLYIYRVGSKTIELTQERMDSPFDDMPAWSPDGSRIAFVRTDGQTRLYLIRPNGTGLRRLTSISASNPSWSPDGKRLVFDTGRRIAVIGVDGRNVRYLTNPKGTDRNPAWSPDGRTIAFTRYGPARSRTSDIWLMNANGSNPRLLVRNSYEAAWKPG